MARSFVGKLDLLSLWHSRGVDAFIEFDNGTFLATATKLPVGREAFMSEKLKQSAQEERILICMGGEANANFALSTLEQNGFETDVCRDLRQFCQKAEEGAGAGLLGEDVVLHEDLSALLGCLADQPIWSDFPLIVATSGGEPLQEALKKLRSTRGIGNVIFAGWPLGEPDLVNAAYVSLRARRRQYAIRTLMDQREAILTGIDDPFLLLDWDFRILYANERAAQIFGHSADELLGKSQWEICPNFVGTAYHQALLEAVEQNEIRRVEYQNPENGRWYEKRIYPSRAGISVFGVDITERKLTEEAVHRSEERFRRMVESAVEYAIFSMDCSGIITSWNKGAQRLLGYSESEAVGQKVDLIFTPEDRKSGIPGWEISQAREKGHADDERWHMRKDGSKFFANGQIMPMASEDGRIHGYVKILRDYTGRKRAETWLRALNETLEKRVAERTAEAERRATQLQMLAAQLTEAEERERRRLAEMLHDHLQQILVAAKMQVSMLTQRQVEASLAEGLERVDNLLERSVEASRSLTVELSPPILYDAGLASALQWLARRASEDHGLTVSVEAEDGSGPESESVQIFLFQAVRELLLNIVKHAGVKEAQVKLAHLENDVEVSVTDAGTGFDSSDPRGKASSQPRGSGFGLFSIDERVGLLGGSMHVESSPGKGTSVSVRVPQREPRAARRQKPERTEKVAVSHEETPVSQDGFDGARIRVLLADDHKILREGLVGLLREQPDFEVVSEASDGQMALEMARETHPDVIIMDVSMPRLNGVEATRRILAEMPEVKVVGLSMHAQEDMADAMRKAGAIGYVTKGAPSEILTAAVRNAALGESSAKRS